MIKTIFVFNTGSSSVKISLLAPPTSTDHVQLLGNNVNPSSSSGAASSSCSRVLPSLTSSSSSSSSITATKVTPIRILTAHAERIGSPHSFITIAISSKLSKYVSHMTKNKTNKANNSYDLNHQDSLDHTSRRNNQVGGKYKENRNTHDVNTKEQETRSNLDHAAVVTTIEVKDKPNMTHEGAIRIIMEEIDNYDKGLLSTVAAVGHRVVHGGSLSDAVIVNDEVMDMIRNASHLAPLHNPNNLLGIEIGKEIFKGIPQIAVFDTAFHTTIPEYAHTYAIPKEYREKRIRKYGFHGTSVKYVSKIAIERLKQLAEGGNGYTKPSYENESKLVIAHLGNGASVTAVVDGKSVDTTMEFTPLSGLMMGTRSGSIDPTVVAFASSQMKKSHDEVIKDLNEKSGLMSISNGDSDMRSIEKRASSSVGDKDAILALDMFVYILAKHIAAMIVACGGYGGGGGRKIDALVFTAGIGENSALVRKKTIKLLQSIITGHGEGSCSILDDTLNEQNGQYSNGIISSHHHGTHNSRENGNEEPNPAIMVIHTDEECGIYEECKTMMTL